MMLGCPKCGSHELEAEVEVSAIAKVDVNKFWDEFQGEHDVDPIEIDLGLLTANFDECKYARCADCECSFELPTKVVR